VIKDFGDGICLAGKSVGCLAFLPVGRGEEGSRPCNRIYISRKPRPMPACPVGRGVELHSSPSVKLLRSVIVLPLMRQMSQYCPEPPGGGVYVFTSF